MIQFFPYKLFGIQARNSAPVTRCAVVLLDINADTIRHNKVMNILWWDDWDSIIIVENTINRIAFLYFVIYINYFWTRFFFTISLKPKRSINAK